MATDGGVVLLLTPLADPNAGPGVPERDADYRLKLRGRLI